MIKSQKIHNDKFCSSCYFRSIAVAPYRKAIIQLTERCNMHCEHCFVSSTATGQELSYQDIESRILPSLKMSNVKKVTLTGGEPFVYPDLLKTVRLLSDNNISVSICTNATLISESFIESIIKYDSVHFNVSLDGFSYNSHGRFRGNESPELFEKIISNIILLGRHGLLNGILVTPNIYSSIEEYKKICEFAQINNAKYVLMNPLSEFGRGQDSISKAFSQNEMSKLKNVAKNYNSEDFEVVCIRFPNNEKLPLGDCVAGKIFYIFSDGLVTPCPYTVFAAKDSISKYHFSDFCVGNILEDNFDLEKGLSDYQFPKSKNIEGCDECVNRECSGGCAAAKISKGLYLSEYDIDLCPLIDKE